MEQDTKYKAHDDRGNFSMRRMTLTLLVAFLLVAACSVPVGASTARSALGSESRHRTDISDKTRSEDSVKKESGIPAAPKAKNSADSLKKIKQAMNQKLSDSNRLSRDVESVKKKAGKIAETAKNRIRQILKNSDKLSGDQIVALKDVVLQLKQYHDNVDAQEQAISEILVRLQDLRSMEKYAESVPVLDELITAQKKMIEILKGSGTAMTHIGTILKS